MRRFASALAAVFTAFAFAGQAAYAAPVGCDIQNNGTGAGTSTVPVLGGSTFILDGTIRSSALGLGTFHEVGTQTGPTSFTYTGTTQYRGGTVTQTGNGTNTGPNTATVINTITGGTGRFRGVTGTSTIMSVSSPTPNPQVATITLTFTGTVHLPHRRCGDSPEPLHPVTGTTSGTAIIDSATGTGTSDGPFHLTVLGTGTLHNDFTSSTQTGNTITLTGAAIWSTRAESDAATAKGGKENGNKVFTTFTTTVTVTSTGFMATTVNTITGGTGRFEDASGTMTVTGSGVTVSTVGSVSTSTFTSKVQGQISF